MPSWKWFRLWRQNGNMKEIFLTYTVGRHYNNNKTQPRRHIFRLYSWGKSNILLEWVKQALCISLHYMDISLYSRLLIWNMQHVVNFASKVTIRCFLLLNLQLPYGHVCIQWYALTEIPISNYANEGHSTHAHYHYAHGS